MSIKSVRKLHRKRPMIDLTGPEGNVFVLMAFAKQYAKQLGKDGKAITDDMKSSNYDHAVNVFEREFGEHVDLYR